MSESYVEYDEFGIVCVRCMQCGIPVAERTVKEVRIPSIPPKTENVLVVKRLSSWRQRRTEVEGGGYVDLILCSDCHAEPVSMADMTEKIAVASEATWAHEGRSEKDKAIFRKSLPTIARVAPSDELMKEQRGR
ncbi:MAG: hypothetical protein WC277_03580 [Bacilli bacterium]|jgi:hypothetical protein